MLWNKMFFESCKILPGGSQAPSGLEQFVSLKKNLCPEVTEKRLKGAQALLRGANNFKA